ADPGHRRRRRAAGPRRLRGLQGRRHQRPPPAEPQRRAGGLLRRRRARSLGRLHLPGDGAGGAHPHADRIQADAEVSPDVRLYYFPTPNGRKVSIALEEMELAYEVEKIDILGGEQQRPDFLAISPNGRIPAL